MLMEQPQPFRKKKRVSDKNLSLMHRKLNLCNNALHEENITLNGEIVDLEYASSSTKEGIYRDIWYGLLSFAEIFGTPLDISRFAEGYAKNKKIKKINIDVHFKNKNALDFFKKFGFTKRTIELSLDI